MNEIDALTLRLLTSKRRYNNYLATANPNKSAEIQEYYDKVRANSGRIKKIIGKYLENPETETSNEIDDMLENCFKILLKHLLMQDYEDKCAKTGYDAEDSSDEEDELGADDEVVDDEVVDDEVVVDEVVDDEVVVDKVKPTGTSSFWGKRVMKNKGISTTLDNFIKKSK